MELNVNLLELIAEYKQAALDYDIACKKKEYLKDRLLETVQWKAGTYRDVVISNTKAAAVINWAQLARDTCISQELMSRYTTHRPEGLRITIKRSIKIEE